MSKIIGELSRLLRKQESAYPLYTISTILLLLLHIQHWWGTFADDELLAEIHFFEFVGYLFPFILLVIATDMFIPKNEERSYLIIRKHYWGNKEYFFLTMVFYLFSVMALDEYTNSLILMAAIIRTIGILFVLGLALLEEKDEQWHYLLLLVIGILLALYVGFVTPNLK